MQNVSRPLRRKRGRDSDRAPTRAEPTTRPTARSAGSRRGREVLGLQADAAARRRSARMPSAATAPSRSRGCPALSRKPARLDLGGLRERGRARRPARARPQARDGRGVPGGSPARRTATDARLDAAIGRARPRARRAEGAEAPAGCSSCSRSTLQGSLSSAIGAPRSPTPSARGSSGRAASTERFPSSSTRRDRRAFHARLHG